LALRIDLSAIQKRKSKDDSSDFLFVGLTVLG